MISLTPNALEYHIHNPTTKLGRWWRRITKQCVVETTYHITNLEFPTRESILPGIRFLINGVEFVSNECNFLVTDHLYHIKAEACEQLYTRPRKRDYMYKPAFKIYGDEAVL